VIGNCFAQWIGHKRSRSTTCVQLTTLLLLLWVTLITKSNQIGPNQRYPVPNQGHIVKYLLWTKSYTSALDQSNRTTSDQIADTHYQIGTIFWPTCLKHPIRHDLVPIYPGTASSYMKSWSMMQKNNLCQNLISCILSSDTNTNRSY